MCGNCGCDQGSIDTQTNQSSRTVDVAVNVFERNDHIAAHNRSYFSQIGLRVFNIMSGPGSGKTTMIEQTILRLADKSRIKVLVGDQQTDHDARRINTVGGRAKQITTHGSCHLDASMIEAEIGPFIGKDLDILLIENVGNLVCPAAFNLGENTKVVLLSVTEGEDKPVKYPSMFHRADLVILTKTDLMPHLEWDRDVCISYIRKVNPSCQIISLSNKTGEGFDDWLDFLLNKSEATVRHSAEEFAVTHHNH